MNSGAWVSITPLQDGQPLNADILNEPLKDLENRTDYLKSLLGVFGNPFSQVVVSFESVATGLTAGDVVYLGNDGKPAKASGAPDVLDEFMACTSSYLIGIYTGNSERIDQSAVVHNVHNVAVCGQATISLDNFVRIGGTDSGVYFLSTNSGEEGQITQTPVGARILVGTFIKGTNDVKVILTPTHNSFAEAHVHRSSILKTDILHVEPDFSETESYAADDLVTYEYSVYKCTQQHLGPWDDGDFEFVSTIEGWYLLGEDSAEAFDTSAAYSPGDFVLYDNKIYKCVNEHQGSWLSDDFEDVSGVYYYKSTPGSILATFWPPTPLEALTFVLDGKELIQSKDALEGLTTYTVSYESGYSEYILKLVPSETPTGTIGDTAVIHYVRGVYGDTGPVTSLRPAPGSPITVHKCGTSENSNVGDLELDLDWDAQDKDANTPGFNVYKEFKNGIFLRGPVVEKIKGGDGIDVTSTDRLGHGTVVISSNVNSTGQFDTVALQNAKQEMVDLFPYISLPAYNSSVPAAFIAKFQAPLTLTNDNGYKVLFYATLFGTTNGAQGHSAGVEFLYSMLPDGGETSSNLQDGIVSGTATQVLIPFGSGYTAFDPILFTNDEAYSDTDGAVVVSDLISGDPTVRASYQFAVKLTRSEGQYYTGALGFLNLRWRLVPVL